MLLSIHICRIFLCSIGGIWNRVYVYVSYFILRASLDILLTPPVIVFFLHGNFPKNPIWARCLWCWDLWGVALIPRKAFASLIYSIRVCIYIYIGFLRFEMWIRASWNMNWVFNNDNNKVWVWKRLQVDRTDIYGIEGFWKRIVMKVTIEYSTLTV